jgi:virginiamycin B lyase
MALDSQGDIFVVLFGTNRIAKVAVKTAAIREYLLPHPEARPRRVAITRDDLVWYTDYARGYLGRLDPSSGEVREWPSPSGPKSEPYGISAVDGIIWYSESGTKPNTVVRFEPRTADFQSWPIPGGGDIVRNASVARDGAVVLANSLVNQVTVLRVQRSR